MDNFAQIQAMHSQANSLASLQASAELQRKGAQLLADQKVTMANDTLSGNSQAGTLYVHDSFTPNSFYEAEKPHANPHGVHVARSARRQGFQGRIIGSSNVLSANQNKALAQLTDLSRPNASHADILKNVRGYAENISSGLLDGRSDRLEQLSRGGARNSAVNFSQGESKASTTSALYDAAANSWSQDPRISGIERVRARGVLNNYARAFELDMSKLASSDSKVSGPERLRLQQRLATIVDQTYKTSPVLAASQKRYDQAVDSFESGRNSVVVSAGNEFDFLDKMASDSGGRRIQADESFTHNVLENDAVTSVGATRWFQNGDSLKEVRAGYSSRGSGVDIYATGSLGAANHQKADAFGTSYASPRVAATMAEIHRRNPNMSSAQVEAVMRENLTHGLSDSRGEMEVLDHQRTAAFLAGGTF